MPGTAHTQTGCYSYCREKIAGGHGMINCIHDQSGTFFMDLDEKSKTYKKRSYHTAGYPGRASSRTRCGISLRGYCREISLRVQKMSGAAPGMTDLINLLQHRAPQLLRLLNHTIQPAEICGKYFSFRISR